MKRYKYFLGISLCGLLCCACGKHDAQPVNPDESIHLDYSVCIAKEADTRTPGITGTQFPYDEYRQKNGYPDQTEYGMTAWVLNAGTLTPHMAGFDDINIVYTAKKAASGSFTTKPSIYIKKSSEVDLYASYPRSSSKNPQVMSFNTTSQTDYMYAEPIHLTSAQTDGSVNPLPVTFRFHHAMTCVEIWVKCKFDYTSVDLTSITLSDSNRKLVTNGTLDVTTGEVKPGTKNQPSIKISGNNTGGNGLSNTGRWEKYAFMMPEYDGFDGTNLVLSFVFDTNIPGRNTYTLPNVLTDSHGNPVTISKFEKGHRYIYQLELDNELLIEPLHQIAADWETKDITLIM